MKLEAIKHFAQSVLGDDTTGHDWKHALRVENTARQLSSSDFTDGEMETILVSCWLHDTIDDKLADHKRQSVETIEQLLLENDATADQVAEVLHIIQHLSYSKNLAKKRELSAMGQIVQDADRLDAIGAIGIARAFYYGGHKKDALYDDSSPRNSADLTEETYRAESTVLNHFYEKLLLLEETMNTDAGKREAAIRTDFMKEFLKRFYEEIAES